jgi:hypothetical protein
MASPHSYQMVDGGDVFVQIASLVLPNRVIATRNATSGILTYSNQPILHSGAGSSANQLVEVTGSSEFNTTFGKSNKTFRLFNDSGWEQDKITGRNWQATMNGMFVRNGSLTAPDLEDSFKTIFENALAKEEEVYIKFLKNLGSIAAPAPISVTANDTTDIVTFSAAHGLATGNKFQFASTGTLPAPLVTGNDYYAVVLSATTIKVAASKADAVATVPVIIDLTTAGTAVITGVLLPKTRYQIEAGNAKVINFGDQAQADGILQVSATFKGQGAFIYGFEEIAA